MNNTPLDDLEYKIYLSHSPNAKKGNELKLPEANEFVKNLKNTSEGLSLCLSNFSSFKNEDSRMFTLEILIYWLERRFSELPPPVITAILGFLTTTAIDHIGPVGAEGFETLAEAQATFTIKTYLGIFPDVIEKFFLIGNSNDKNVILLRYILCLFKKLTTPSPMTIELHRSFVEKMNQDGSLITFAQIVQNGIRRRNMIAVGILIYYGRFLDISFLDSDFLTGLADDLYDELRDKYVPLVYLTLLQRQETIENKKSFIGSLQLNEELAQFCSNTDYSEIVMARMGYLLSFLGFTFDNEPNYYNLATQLGSLTVLSYINSYTLKHPDCLQNTLNFIINRLKTHFTPKENKPIEFIYDISFIHSLQEVCFNCFVINQEVSEQVLVTFLNNNQNIINEFPSIMALLLILLGVFQSELRIVQIPIFIPLLTQLMQNVTATPLFDDQHSALYSIFFSIILIFDERYPTPVVFQPEQIFRGILPFTVNANYFQRKFQRLLVKCCLKYGVQNNLNENDFNIFTQPTTYSNGKIYGSLVNCAPVENRSAIIQSTITKLLETLKNNPSEEFIIYSLSIMTSMKCPLEQQVLQTATEFIQQMLSNSTVQNNDFLLSRAIKGLSTLRLSAIHIFLQLYGNVTTILSLTASANLASSIRRIASAEKLALEAEIPNNDPGFQTSLDNSWVGKFASFLISQLQIFNQSTPLYEKEELGNYFKYVKSVVNFISNEIPNVPPQDLMTLATILLDGVNRFYDSPDMNESFLSFGTILSYITNPEIADVLIKFIQASLNFIYSQDIVLLSERWIKVLIKMIEFYQRLNLTMQANFQENLISTVQSIGGIRQTAQAFISGMESIGPNLLYPMMNYAINFCFELLVNRRYI
ncbi:hypothetical protein M9Y10_011172 [Tritrichomonas musculus]|uniref:Uncharacterized protein n=1 Tax=Tritrichomonas musculus TaxID=1915356 RepID=A0ABR2IK30_9EUKA